MSLEAALVWTPVLAAIHPSHYNKHFDYINIMSFVEYVDMVTQGTSCVVSESFFYTLSNHFIKIVFAAHDILRELANKYNHHLEGLRCRKVT